jgi:hypothetical protein
VAIQERMVGKREVEQQKEGTEIWIYWRIESAAN